MSMNEFEREDNKVDRIVLSEIIERYLYQWKYLLLSIIICLSVAFIYLRYSIPIYSSSATVLVKNSESKQMGPDLSALKDLGFSNGSKGLENEIEVYKSRTLIKKIVEKLHLNEELYIIGSRSRIQRAKLYKNAPIIAKYTSFDSSLLKKTYSLEIEIINNNQIRIETTNGKNINANFDQNIELPFAKVAFNKSPAFEEGIIGSSFTYYISPIENTVTNLKNRLKISSVNKDVDIINLTIEGEVIEENNQFLNELIHQHRIDAIKDKNQVAENTNNFLSKRLVLLENQLNSIEEEAKDYKKGNTLTNVGTDAEKFIKQQANIESAITQSEIQLSLANYMNDYIDSFDKNNSTLLPANLGFEDLAINQMTADYNALVLERNTLLQTSSRQNPAVSRIDRELESLLVSLSNSLNNLKSRINLEIEILKKQDRNYQAKIGKLPQFELDYRGIIRQQEIKESLYIFLLKKKEENEISMAANVSNTKTIDLAYSNKIPVSPKKKIIYIIALLLGLFIPVSIIYIKDIFDTKIKNQEDIEALNLPLAGTIPQSKEDDKIVTKNNLRSPMAEAFRMLRTNISFLLNNDKTNGKLIYVTSTIAGEGKTLTSLNLARSLAFTDKKIILIGLDLRKPKLFEYMGIEQGQGVADFLVNPNIDIESLYLQSEEFDNLKYLSSGSIPPNPSELLLNQRLEFLLNKLQEEFDYIVVDTAPASLVTDTISISRFSDLTLYVTRANYLDKRMLKIPLNFYKKKSLGEMAILLNSVKTIGSSKNYGYGYSYGYGEEKKRSFFDKLIGRNK